MKKEHLQANFDDQTKVEIRRFEDCANSEVMLNEYQQEIADTAKNLYDAGALKLEV